ncbi:hypothetical protein EGR_06186 [Echinococcus granulosus]|uniref:Uncharacterized protein n=1 Tax=Echinococcus granulosus TaxID=6210 RepID=W6ULI7_ECHGR|nr:hypothetical protein EGR_06186 [Echinococcus granulosus]EUB58967.1 hypothetical protein EGR_06186 [Echinococcus granulosus]
MFGQPVEIEQPTWLNKRLTRKISKTFCEHLLYIFAAIKCALTTTFDTLNDIDVLCLSMYILVTKPTTPLLWVMTELPLWSPSSRMEGLVQIEEHRPTHLVSGIPPLTIRLTWVAEGRRKSDARIIKMSFYLLPVDQLPILNHLYNNNEVDNENVTTSEDVKKKIDYEVKTFYMEKKNLKGSFGYSFVGLIWSTYLMRVNLELSSTFDRRAEKQKRIIKQYYLHSIYVCVVITKYYLFAIYKYLIVLSKLVWVKDKLQNGVGQQHLNYPNLQCTNSKLSSSRFNNQWKLVKLCICLTFKRTIEFEVSHNGNPCQPACLSLKPNCQ